MYFSKAVRWALLALTLVVPVFSHAQIAITVTVAPPVLPVYEQPLCPEEGWMWIPGYWAWGEDGYYWVPGEWVPAPYVGALWTPPWWGWQDGRYRFHDGYWADEVGYYGGINYGYGYMGVGFVGGEWRSGGFAYNTAVMRVNTSVIHDTYVNETIVRNNTIANQRHIAFNGGQGGIRHDPSPVERRAMAASHTAPTQVQREHLQSARANREAYAKVNNGHPRMLAMSRPAETGRAVDSHEASHRSPAAGDRSGRAENTPRSEPRQPQPNLRKQGQESRTEAKRAETRPSSPRSETELASHSRSEAHAGTSERPRNQSRPVTEPRQQQATPRTESRQAAPRPATHTEAHSTPNREPRSAPDARTQRPGAESRPVPHTEAHSAPARESRPVGEPRQQAATPHNEARPAAEPRAESHAAAPHQSRPSEPRTQNHPAAAEHSAPQHEARNTPSKPEREKPEPH